MSKLQYRQKMPHSFVCLAMPSFSPDISSTASISRRYVNHEIV